MRTDTPVRAFESGLARAVVFRPGKTAGHQPVNNFFHGPSARNRRGAALTHGKESENNSMDTAVNGMDTAVNGMDTAVNDMDTTVNGMDTAVNDMDTAVNGMDTAVNDMDTAVNDMEVCIKIASGRVRNGVFRQKPVFLAERGQSGLVKGRGIQRQDAATPSHKADKRISISPRLRALASWR